MKKIISTILILSILCFGSSAISAEPSSGLEYDYTGSYSEGYAVVGMWEGYWKYGYINKTGNIVIKPAFNYAENFSDGIAIVGMGKDKTSQKYGYIKKDGNYLFKPQFDYVTPMRQGFAMVGMNQEKTWRFGIIDKKGNVIAKPIYEHIDLSEYTVSSGYAITLLNGKYGLINLKTGAAISPKYQAVTFLGKYIRISNMVEGKEKFGIMFLDGRTIEPTYDWLHYYDGVKNVFCMVEKNGKFGLLGLDGKYILEPIYDEIRQFNDGVSHVKLGDKYGYFDSDGTFLTKIEYEDISAFMRGVSLVKKNGKWGLLNIDGTYKVEPAYDQIFVMQNEIQVIQNGVKKVLNKDGDLKFDADYEYMYPYSSIEGASKVKKNGKEIILDSKGKPIFNVDFDTIGEFENEVAYITLNSKVGYLKRDGKYMVKPIYDGVFKDIEESYYHTKINEIYGLVFEDGTVIEPMSSAPILFKDDIGIIRIDAKMTYIDKKGKLLNNEKYDYACPFSDGMGRVTINLKTTYVNSKGVKLNTMFDFGEDFSDGFACVYEKGRYLFINKEGQNTFGGDNKFLSAKPFSRGLAAVLSTNGKWGYINTKGELAIPYKFDGAYRFDEKLAPVKVGSKFGFIDKTGKIVVQPAYDIVTEFQNGIANVWKDKKYGFITKDGKYMTDASKNKNFKFSDGFAPVQALTSKGDRYYWGYIRTDGSWMAEPQFDFAIEFYNGVGMVWQNNKMGEITKTGSVTWK